VLKGFEKMGVDREPWVVSSCYPRTKFHEWKLLRESLLKNGKI